MALGHYRARRHADAAVLYGFILRLCPERGTAWRGLGACAHALKSFDNAVRCYENALAADKDDLVSKVFLGEALCQLGKKKAGLEHLNDVVAKGARTPAQAPYVARARAVVGAKGGQPPRIVLMRQGKHIVEQASDALAAESPRFDENAPLTTDDMLENPNLKPLISELAKAVDEGRLSYAQVGGFSEKELEGAYAVACQYLETGNILQAMQIAGFLMFIDSNNWRHPQLIGVCLMRMKQYGPADYFFSVSLADDEKNPRTLVYSGEAKIMAGTMDEGLALVRRGLEAAGSAPEHRDMAERAKVLLKQFGRG
jgi:tetratricopeptide (TPR) repeat protein